jgi:hypothetical protein
MGARAIATWPRFEAGVARVHPQPHRARVCPEHGKLEPRVVGVAQGEPITEDAAERVYGLVER